MINLSLILLLFCNILHAPEKKQLIIFASDPIQPYEAIWKAVCFIESENDPFAYHLEDNGNLSLGIAQISQGKVTDFNQATGNNYKHFDMYNPVKSKEVFMWHCNRFELYETERMIRSWNGSGESTKEYLIRIQAVIKH